MLTQKSQPQIAREHPRAVTPPGRIMGWAVISGVIQYGTGQFAVVGPRSAVEVVAADAGPHVVDHADLGVHVHRYALVVFHIEDVDPFGTSAPACLNGVIAANEVGRQRKPAVHIGVSRDHRDKVQVQVVGQRISKQMGDLRGPQVLVLEIDQPPRP